MENIAWGVAIVGEFWGKPLDEGVCRYEKDESVHQPPSQTTKQYTSITTTQSSDMISSPHMIMVANSCAGHADRYNILVWVFDV